MDSSSDRSNSRINGAFVGLMYALVALGIVLIYKTSGFANLAQGAIAMTGGYIPGPARRCSACRCGWPSRWRSLLMFGVGMAHRARWRCGA